MTTTIIKWTTNDDDDVTRMTRMTRTMIKIWTTNDDDDVTGMTTRSSAIAERPRDASCC